MNKNNWIQSREVQDYLLDIVVYDVLDEIVNKHGLTVGREDELLDLSDAVMKGSIQIDQTPVLLGKAFGLDKEKAKQVACDLVGHRLLPLSDFIPEVENSIKAWGGDVSVYPDLRIKKPQVDDELAGFANDIGLELPDHLMKRFVFLSRGYINKERDHDATLTLLKRPITIGGLEMTEAQAQKLFEMLDAKFVIAQTKAIAVDIKEEPKEEISIVKEEKTDDEVPVVTEEKPKPEKTTRAREIMPIKAVPMALTTDVPVIAGSIMHDDEEREIVEHKKQLGKLVGVKDDKYSQDQEEIIESTAKVIFGFFKNAKQTQQSARELSRSFVKGLIDAQRAHSILVDKYSMGSDDALLVLKSLQDGYEKLNKKPEISQKTVQNNTIASQEVSLLDQRHAVLTKTVPKESVQSVLPKARVSASRTKEEELAGSKSKINIEDLKEAQEKSKPEKAKVMLSAQSVAPKNKQDVASKVVDISYSQKLVGPIEELGTMSIVEFRRLSSDPMEAARKIFGVLELLEEDDYEQRVKGVLAWRKSPLQNLYLSLTQESLLNGVSMSDVASMRRNKGEATLSASEIDAMVEINNRTRF